MQKLVTAFALLVSGTALACDPWPYNDVGFIAEGGSCSSGMTWKIRTVTCREPAVDECSGELEIVTYGSCTDTGNAQTTPFSYEMYRVQKPNGSLHFWNFDVRSVGGASDPVLLDMRCKFWHGVDGAIIAKQNTYRRASDPNTGECQWLPSKQRYRVAAPLRCFGSALPLGDFDNKDHPDGSLSIRQERPRGVEIPSWARIP